MKIHASIIALLLLLPAGVFSQGKAPVRQSVIALSALTPEQKDLFFQGDSVVQMPAYRNPAKDRSTISGNTGPKFPDETDPFYGTDHNQPVMLPPLTGDDYYTFEFDTRKFPGLVGAQDVGRAYFMLHIPEDAELYVAIHNYDSELPGTGITVFAETWGESEVPLYPDTHPSESEWWDDQNRHDSFSPENPHHLMWSHAYFNSFLPPGDYLVVTNGAKMSNASPINGPMRITIRTTSMWNDLNMPMCIGQDPSVSYNVREVGTQTMFSNSYTTEKYWNTFGGGGKDIHHVFNIAADSVDVTFTVKSELSQPTSVYLFRGKDYNRPIASATAQAGAVNGKSVLKQRLKPGQYMAVAEGGDPAETDNITIDIQGAVPKDDLLPETGLSIAEAIDLGTFSADFTVDDTRNTVGFRNDYGTPANEVYHKFTLGSQMRVTLSHTAGLEDTRLFVLQREDSGYTLIDQTHGPQTCKAGESSKRADLSAVLAPGTYIVISEGGDAVNGTINLHASGVVNYCSGTGPALSSNKNYVYSAIPNLQVSSPDNLPVGCGAQQVSYFDGLGRPQQQVQIGISPDLYDLTALQEYDRLGRPSCSWLPAPVPGQGGYAAPAGVTAAAQECYGDDYPYTLPSYEDSPIDRISKQCGPGSEWHTNDKAAYYQYLFNDSADPLLTVRRFAAGTAKESPVLTDAGIYPDARLHVVIATDEDGHMNYTFTDSGGKTVLERRIGDNAEYLDTYYVYNNYGNLCFVLPPEASAGLTPSNREERTDQFGYRYRYDDRDRCIAKKLPGTEWIHMVYDRAGRLLFTQDGGLQKQGKWLCTLSDPFGRPALSGFYTGSVDPETFRSASVTVHFDPLGDFGYAVDGPVDASLLEIGSVNYYDDYRFRSCVAGMSNAALDYDPFSGGVRCGADDDRILHKGLLTGSVTAIVEDGASRMVYAVNYYDDRKRMIQSRNTNPLGGISATDTRYDFSGNVLSQRERHTLTATGRGDELTKTFAYDHASRLLSESASLNASTPAVVTYSYDRLGRLNTQTQGVESTAVTSHNYNLRGWLTAKTNPLFAMLLRYTSVQHAGPISYTGNISEWEWTYDGGATKYTYAFAYDPLSRLSHAYHFAGDIRDYRFEERDIEYDGNGNILALTSTDHAGITDRKVYTYSGNQLMSLGGGSYAYDQNGNMTTDGANGLDLTYNHLNLLEKVEKDGRRLANYSYLWNGTKFSALDAADAGLVYLGSLVYSKQGDNLTLESAAFSGGRFVSGNTGFTPYYYLTDHLGSVRAIVNKEGIVQEQNDYYPFGLRYNTNGEAAKGRYLFNGKEEQAFVNLPYSDYGARMYDPRRGTWTGVDPLAEIDPSTNPFVFCNNNPLRYVDHFGLSAQDTLTNVNVEPVVVTANKSAGLPPWWSIPSLVVTIQHKTMDDISKSGHYLGRYNGEIKEYSTRFYGNKQISATTVAAQKAKFAKRLKRLTRLKGVFTALGALDAAEKAEIVISKLRQGKDISDEEWYNATSAAIGLAGVYGASLSLLMDCQQLSTENALEILEETGDKELFFKMIQPGPRNF